MAADQFANFATSTTAVSALTTASTSLTLATNDGAKFPSKFPFMAMLGTPTSTYELVKVTNRVTDTLTIVRAQEGTTAGSWGIGSSVAQVATAGNWANLWAQVPQQGFFNVLAYGAKGDGVTDDTVACQAAINACQTAGSGAVLFPAPLTFLISSPLVVSADNVMLLGEGWGSQLLAASGFGTNPMIHVTAPGGAFGFRRGLVMKDFYLNGNNVAGVSGLQLDSVYHAEIFHLAIRYCPATSVFFNGASNAFGAYNHLTDCTITDGGAGFGVQTSYNEWLIISGCSFVTFTSTGGTALKITSLNCIVTGCQFDNCDTAILMSFAGRSTISNCQFDRAKTRFIYLQGNQGTTISNCSFNTRSGTGNEMIFVSDRNNLGNTITGCAVEPGTTWPYFINEASGTGGPGNRYIGNNAAGLKMNLVTGKAANNSGFNPLAPLPTPAAAPGLATAGTGGTIAAGTYQVEVSYVNAYGETLPSASASIVTTGTTSTITITAPPQVGNASGWYAYVTQAGAGTYYRQQAAGQPTGFNVPLTLTATPTTTGANPAGANTTAGFTQPAVPATTVAYENNLGVDATVYVTGGTVSAIALNGVSTGLTSGVFQVPAYQTITLTYSAAPTWLWVGE